MKAGLPSLYHMLRETAERHPSRRYMHHADAWMTFGEMLERVDRLANGLAREGVDRGDCFVIALRNSPDFVAFYLALSKLGAIAVPINFMISKADELEFMLADCKAVGVLTQKDFGAAYEKVRSRLPELKHIVGTDFTPVGGVNVETLAGGPQSSDSAGVASREDVACILYTSGTTGRPKGVLLSHGNLLSNCEVTLQILALKPSDVFLCILPMFHTFAWTACVLVPIFIGARVTVVTSIAPPAPWLKLMGRLGVTVFPAVPQLFSVLAKEAVGFKGLVLRWWSFRRTRLAVSGAAPLPLETLKDFEARIGVPILEGFGLTETSPVVSINTPNERRPGTVGKPVPGTSIRITDDAGKEVPTGEEGEVLIKGPQVTRGYHAFPEATRDAFTPDGWFKTGDIGVMDADGYLSIRDRKKDMIIVKGLKVFPAQVEAVIQSHPAVAEAAVVGIPGEGGDETIKSYVVVKKGETVEKAELMRFMKDKLDPYKRPRDIELVDSLPKNALQKVLKRVLRQQELEKRKAKA